MMDDELERDLWQAVRIVVALILVCVMVVLAGLAWTTRARAQQQQPQCGPADAIERQLSGQYKESPRWLGRVSDGRVNFILAMSPDRATWTIYWRRSDGMACLLAAGVKGDFIDGPKGETF